MQEQPDRSLLGQKGKAAAGHLLPRMRSLGTMLPMEPALATAQGCHSCCRCSTACCPVAGTSWGRHVGPSAEVGKAAKQMSTSTVDSASCTCMPR